MIFSPGRTGNSQAAHSLSVKLDGEQIEQVKSYKYLGNILDDQLNCDKIFASTLKAQN